MKRLSENDILKLIEEDSWMMSILRAAESLNLPDWWMGAGFVRSKVWDYLHGYKKRTPLPDIDLIYFDKSAEEADEKNFENILTEKVPGIKWQIKNQARMHLLHNRPPYENSEEALSEWAETATCIGVRLTGGKLKLIAPHGIEDLVSLIVRPIPDYAKKYRYDPNTFQSRLKEKKWLSKWPKLRIAG